MSKTGPFRLYVVHPWSHFGCTSLYYKETYCRNGTRGLLRKGETARFSTPQLDHIGAFKRFVKSFYNFVSCFHEKISPEFSHVEKDNMMRPSEPSSSTSTVDQEEEKNLTQMKVVTMCF